MILFFKLVFIWVAVLILMRFALFCKYNSKKLGAWKRLTLEASLLGRAYRATFRWGIWFLTAFLFGWFGFWLFSL